MSSNNLTQVRDYINTRMAVVEPTFKEWVESLEYIGNIPKTLLDKTYHVDLLGLSSTPKTDSHIEDSFGVLVSIFKRTFNDQVGARDELLQTGNCIRLDMIKPTNIESYKFANDGNIEDVQSVSITPTEIDASNDNIIKLEIELNVRLFFGTT